MPVCFAALSLSFWFWPEMQFMAMPTEVQPKRTTKCAWHKSLVPSEDAAMLRGAAGAPSRVQQFVWPVVLVLCGVAALAIDIPVARWFRISGLPGDLNKLVQLAEVFGHGFSTAIIFLAVWMLAPQLRSRLPRAMGIAYFGGLGAILVKELVVAQRPHTIERLFGTPVLSTFQKWFPGLSTDAGLQSFPSGHTALAVGLAVSLIWLLPRGRWLFAALAVLAATQRVASENHFLSDVLWGAAAGLFFSTACLPGGWFSKPFDWIERRLEARAAAGNVIGGH